ncbi:GNAT family N-acetyltransferase [Paenibacillus ginsengarvi]|uniref:GNAT family N-acetyltransferase n=2 Tax=Paenibacillus ginsengarvi TaxID=400777 RepID=A0A3B0BLS9_9BACL|nr:GNAT family N-acetyltransferase [Paenibacillus ginsengarvi]
MAVTIRLMEKRDTEEVRKVARATWHHTYEGIIPERVRTRFLDAFYNDEAILRRMTGSILLVAEREDGIVGFANFFSSRRDPSEAELGAIYILPEAQGGGIGTLLLQEGIGRLRLQGATRLLANVERSNRKGLSFYEAKRFKASGEKEELFYGYALRTVQMKLDLAD